jgi:hypothetical protein
VLSGWETAPCMTSRDRCAGSRNRAGDRLAIAHQWGGFGRLFSFWAAGGTLPRSRARRVGLTSSGGCRVSLEYKAGSRRSPRGCRLNIRRRARA